MQLEPLVVDKAWDGVRGDVVATLALSWEDGLTVRVEAAYAGDAAPASAPGRTERLWQHEVVELFLAEEATRASRYLELELGPHGHWLALGFSAYRQRACADLAASFSATIAGSRWSGTAHLPAAEVRRVIARVGALNAYAICGSGEARRYFAAHPTPPGLHAGPDFHRLEHFALVAVQP